MAFITKYRLSIIWFNIRFDVKIGYFMFMNYFSINPYCATCGDGDTEGHTLCMECEIGAFQEWADYGKTACEYNTGYECTHPDHKGDEQCGIGLDDCPRIDEYFEWLNSYERYSSVVHY